jgi:TRAP-type C4-dicarboxylate transport system permease small subunit
MVAIILVGALSAWLGYEAVSSVRSGVASARGFRSQRTKQPAMFWLAVTVQIGVAVFLFYIMLSHPISN